MKDFFKKYKYVIIALLAFILICALVIFCRNLSSINKEPKLSDKVISQIDNFILGTDL